MANQRRKHRPDVVRRNCQTFLAALGRYRKLLENEARLRFEHEWQPKQYEKSVTQLLAKALRLWTSLNKFGLRLLAAGAALNVTEWMKAHPEWLPIENAGFFEDEDEDYPADHVAPRDQIPFPIAMSKFLKDHPGDGGSWGINLRQTLSWCETNQTPFGFSKFEEENDSDMRDWVIEDVEREVGALLAAATERLFGKDGDLVPPILSERENAVLNVIPFGSAGALTGKQVIDRVKKQHNPNTERLDQAALTKDIIPKLKIFYSVRNRRGVGYYRKPPREKR